jgi:colanic acid/amylovoran biosynthesis glycosyltransferase
MTLRLAVVVGVFPTPTETWIPDQAVGLLARGHDVRLIAQRPERAEALHPIVEASRLLERVTYAPARPIGRAARLAHVPMTALTNLGLGPRAMLGSLNAVRFGPHALSGGLTYPIVALLRAARERPFDLVHAHDAAVGLAPAALRAMRRLDAPLIVTVHGPDINEQRNVRMARGYALLRDHAAAFTVGSEFIRRRLARLGIDDERIHTIPQSIDPALWPFAERSPDPDGAVRLLCIGRLSPVKGVEFAVRALARLRDRHPALRLVIVGDGPLRPNLESLAGGLGVADRVEFKGTLTRDRLLPVMAACHALIHPGVELPGGFAEAQGMVLIEAQACGMPVITTRAGGIPESVDEGRSALVVPHSDDAALAEAVDALLTHSARWPAMGRAGRAFVERRFALEPMLDALTALYARVLGRADAPGSQSSRPTPGAAESLRQ